ncbi:MAG: PhoX family protein, partial [Actinomycetota bacterium]
MTTLSHSGTDAVVDDDVDADDVPSNPSTARHFNDVAEARLSRRSLLTGGMLAAAGFLTAGAVDAPSAQAAPRTGKGAGARALLGFEPIPLGYADVVVVPPGYSATPFIPWGTPILGAFPEFKPGSPDVTEDRTGNTAEEQAQQVGMHHDGMHFFPLGRGPRGGSSHGLLAVNHEYTDENYLHTGTTVRPPREKYTLEMIRKSQAAHGVSVIEVERGRDGAWTVVRSDRNRRITANTPMVFSGPAAGNELVRTSVDADGTRPVGTVNNCSHGVTPWDTYLTCEENFNGYFAVDSGNYDAE